MANERLYKVHTTNGKCFRVRATEHYKGVFANKVEWELYFSDEYAVFRSWSYLGKCATSEQIGEAIRLNISGVKQIEPI